MLMISIPCKLVESIVDVSVDSLVELEDHLETALSVTRAQKAELMLKLVESLKEKENLLKEENQVLASQVGLGTIGRFKYLAIAFLASSARLIINWKSLIPALEKDACSLNLKDLEA
ncbi:hypothetical protein Bca52824_043506 [Brassica carinata]|uniref:K-box domain-containing protein n=1 Tax=Brassica carinata TaxID=52824 RepID=A0A8X7UZS1_BRACI|nr:hypothetical protein Bca52824_043506 [Brassica carinata]